MCASARFAPGSQTEVSLKKGLQQSTTCVPAGYPHISLGTDSTGTPEHAAELPMVDMSAEGPLRTFSGKG